MICVLISFIYTIQPYLYTQCYTMIQCAHAHDGVVGVGRDTIKEGAGLRVSWALMAAVAARGHGSLGFCIKAASGCRDGSGEGTCKLCCAAHTQYPSCQYAGCGHHPRTTCIMWLFCARRTPPNTQENQHVLQTLTMS